MENEFEGKEALQKNVRLRQIRRKKLMMTVEEAADLANVSPTTWQRWEQGAQKPRLKVLKELCQKLQKSPEELGFEDVVE